MFSFQNDHHSMNKDFWNQRYSANDYAYGKTPNVFFAEQLRQIPPGKILLPADGEGRNSVFAATLGWEVVAFDISSEGKLKAEQLAEEHNVSIKYLVGDLESLDLEPQSFDAMALIYAHFPPPIKSKYHQLLQKYLKPNAVLILEAFSKTHLPYRMENPKVGGPNNLEMLFSEAEVKADFESFEIQLLVDTEVELQEGNFHIGKGKVIRFVGKKR